ncbi:hypothetical protein OZ410_02030 [Robiginitalea sp. M366]|uniref:hypothetical protein n=1 Tax=Robiginitalea aestuariiviva TaxID=3036903 RepID=UPI00240E4EA5|nr:hypothetical protein [Robiginitalea aestuariiviva]MDG1571078.1 hypothetical protein [Robiginitalea aestuariiviva]
MLRNCFLSLLFLLAGASVCAQQQVTFKVGYAPESVYQLEVETEVVGRMDLHMPDSLASAMGSAADGFPMEMEMRNTIPYTLTTGAAGPEGYFSWIMAYGNIRSESKMNGQEIQQPENPLTGEMLYGRYGPDRSFVLDSVGGKGFDPAIEGMLKGVMENIQRYMQLPEHPVAVGDSFPMEIPMTIPMAGMNPMEAQITILYTLDAVEGDRAFFTLDQSVTMDMQNEQMEMHVEGQGGGSGIFRISEGFWEEVKGDLPMAFEIALPGEMIITSQMDTRSVVRTSREPARN